VKPLREHFRFVQKIASSGAIGLAMAAQATRFDRYDGVAAPDHDAHWLDYLQTENGEPLQTEANALLEDAA
jgi:hypothetical protein